jgi:hypothetical protein
MPTLPRTSLFHRFSLISASRFSCLFRFPSPRWAARTRKSACKHTVWTRSHSCSARSELAEGFLPFAVPPLAALPPAHAPSRQVHLWLCVRELARGDPDEQLSPSTPDAHARAVSGWAVLDDGGCGVGALADPLSLTLPAHPQLFLLAAFARFYLLPRGQHRAITDYAKFLDGKRQRVLLGDVLLRVDVMRARVLCSCSERLAHRVPSGRAC